MSVVKQDLFENSVQTLKMAWSADRASITLLILAKLADALSTIGIAFVTKGLIDSIVTAAREGGSEENIQRVFVWVGIELALIVVQLAATRFDSYAQVVVKSKLGLHVNLLMLKKASNVSYAQAESEAFQNLASYIRGEVSMKAMDLVAHSTALLRNAIVFLGFAILFVSIDARALFVLVIASILPMITEVRYRRDFFKLKRARALRTRKVSYLESIIMTEPTAKEIKLFGLADWLIEKYRDIYHGFFVEESKMERRHRFFVTAADFLSMLIVYSFYAWLAYQGAMGVLTLGSIILLMSVLKQGQSTLRMAQLNVTGGYEVNLYMASFFEFLQIPEDDPATSLTENLKNFSPPQIDLENVSFIYPDSNQPVLKNINLSFKPNETVALVGRSGAGKTTLIKLLVGLYRPSSGRILIDGQDVQNMTASELRAKIGVIFQDFSRFQFNAGDNIGVGWLPLRKDSSRLSQSIHSAGATEVVNRLSKGLETPLGRAFGGEDLSGGQWQRIALARAFMRKSPILILDEPTASVDAETEHEIFQRFQELAGSRTSIIITHRFSTIRMANKIVVFEAGEVVESGTHSELMSEKGRYATLFQLQAQGYQVT